MAGGKVPVLHFYELGFHLFADISGVHAPRMEAAALRRIGQIGRRSGYGEELLLGSYDARERAHEADCIGVGWLREYLLYVSDLHYLSGVHDSDLLGHLGHYGDVMRYDYHGYPELPLEVPYNSQNPVLHNDIQCGCRFIRYYERWVACKGHGDHGPLPHTSAELVRIAIYTVHIQTDQFEELLHSFPCILLAYVLVRKNGLHYLVTHLIHRVKGVHGALKDDGNLLPADVLHLLIHLLLHLPELLVLEVECVLAPLGDEPVVELYAPADNTTVVGQQPRNGKRSGALATTALTDKAHRLSPVKGEGHSVNSLHATFVYLEIHLQILYF